MSINLRAIAKALTGQADPYVPQLVPLVLRTADLKLFSDWIPQSNINALVAPGADVALAGINLSEDGFYHIHWQASVQVVLAAVRVIAFKIYNQADNVLLWGYDLAMPLAVGSSHSEDQYMFLRKEWGVSIRTTGAFGAGEIITAAVGIRQLLKG